MMVTIHGLHISVKYKDVKQLIKDKCTIDEFILDNLVVDDDQHSKKIRVGLADTAEGSMVKSQLDGMWFLGHQLSVVPFTKSKPPQQQDSRGPNNYQNQSAPNSSQIFGSRGQNQPGPNDSQNFGSRSQNRPNDNFGPAHDNNQRADFRPDRSNYGPPRNDRQELRRPDDQSEYRPNEGRNPNFAAPNSDFGRPRNDNSGYFGPAHQHRMEHNQTPARQDIGGRGPQQNVPSRQEQGQGPPRRDGPFQGYGPRSQNAGDHGPWASNQAPWSSNAVEERGQYQGQANDFDLGPTPSIRVREFGNQERFTPNVLQPQRQDTWVANNVGMPDMTISKDKFQGPAQYSFEPESASPFRGPSTGPSQPPVWATQPQKPELRNAPFTGSALPLPDANRFLGNPDANNRFRNTGPEDGRGDYRRSPPGKRYPSPGLDRSHSPSRRRISPGGVGRGPRSPLRRSPPRIGFSPSRKTGEPVQRVVSPGVRLISPSRRGFEPNRRGRSSISPSDHRVSPPARRGSPTERRITPTARRMGSPRRLSPPSRKLSPRRNRFSPPRFSPGRKSVSPANRGFSPPRRGISPSRRGVSPIKRGISPVNRGRVSPRRGISPSARRISPPRRGISPAGRRLSLERRRSPGRYSPSALYEDDTSPKAPARFHKDVRPAYEPAPAPPKLPSNYRPSLNQNVSFPMHGQGDSKVSSWQPNFAKDDRRPPLEKRPAELSRLEWEPKRSRSRSPMRRDRSSRDRFRRSPSPRTSKVWEKRDSPDAPPPPAWPGAPVMPKSDGKREPVWEPPNFASKDDRKVSRDDPFRRSMPQPSKPHWDMTKQHRPEDSLQDRRDQIRRDDRHKVPSPFVDNFSLEEDEKRHDFRRQEIKASAPLSRFDRREPMPPHEDIHRSTKGDNSFDRHSFNKYNDGREDSYLQQHDGPKLSSDEGNPNRSNRKQAVDIISASLYDKYNIGHRRARDELHLQLSKIVLEMTGTKVMLSDDIVMKFYQNFSNQQQEKIVRDVMSSLPSHLNVQKRIGEDISAVVPKHPRTDANLSSFMTQEQLPTYALVPHPEYGLVQQPIVYPPEMVAQQVMPQMEPGIGSDFQPDDRTLYLCKDNFDHITPHQAEALRDFLVSQIFEATAATGWAPTFMFNGLKSRHRYEITPENDDAANWLKNLDFSKFGFFNVLVYSKEELWYERAAIWLPGHSKCRNIEPLAKLLLQNRHVVGVNIDKWKLVKKIISAKGTRIYVDMPPSSSLALKKNKMLLSYELQQVTVFLRADAVDKNSFDLGISEDSVADPSVILAAIQNAAMPFIHDELSIVKICFKGTKMLSVDQAKKIKEMVIYHLFKYLQQPSVKLRTDFTKYGFCQPGFFAIQPENVESKKWLLGLDIGKLNKHEIVVVGSTSDGTKYLKMQMQGDGHYNSAVILDRLKTATRGKKLNFSKWKIGNVNNNKRTENFWLDLEVDIESAQTIAKNNFKLDFSDRSVVRFVHKYGDIAKAIKKLKAEEVDSYVVANMDIDSSDEGDVVAIESD